MTTHIRTCIYHDSSTKGFKHGIKHNLTAFATACAT
ncbi:Uncharacterised protein [Neisseria meningitidis]|nr:putative phage associated protein [Neisseria meningitidis 73696]CWM19079.1 Uncharacterised protein [Neisseria meningitidis]CWN42919.1 Uncharacterised protein [Neisseria meningitidis]CWO36968.1 Uncharacterised protein [Neisseria meningitidis]CWP38760.1 Uncharacterised protein [Neisseria meningitidis]